MPLEYKSLKAELMGIEDRTVTGLFAVHGNVDSGDGWSSRDRSHPGLFGDFLAKGRARAQFLWQHDGSAPPIASFRISTGTASSSASGASASATPQGKNSARPTHE
jgi:hypothetical protein